MHVILCLKHNQLLTESIKLNQTHRKYSLYIYIYISFENAILSADRGIKSIISTKQHRSSGGKGRSGEHGGRPRIIHIEVEPLRRLLAG